MTTIYIPTYGRVDRQVTHKHLSAHWQARTLLVAVPEEVEPLRQRGYAVLERPTKTISETRQWILDQHDDDLLGPNVVLLDDDLKFYRRRPEYPTRFRQLKPQDSEFSDLMDGVIELLEKSPMAGVTNRSGANRHLDPIRWNVRMHDFLGINVVAMRENGWRIDRVPFMEDFDLILQVLTSGFQVPCLNTFCEGDVHGRDSVGGCSDERTLEKQRAAALQMEELWPGIVKAVEKQNKGEGDWAVRTDVRVGWAKAVEQGRDR